MDFSRLIETLPLVSSFDAALLSQGGAHIQHYDRDQLMYLEGDVCTTLDIVLSGSISIQSLDEEGTVFKAKVLEKGEVWGATLLFSQKNRYPMNVVCDRPAQVLRLPKQLVLQLCEKQQFLVALLGIISDRAHELSRTVHSLSAKTLRESLLSYLYTLKEEQHSTTVYLPISKKELAHRLGFARPSLSRELTALMQEGLLSYHGREVHLHTSSKS